MSVTYLTAGDISHCLAVVVELAQKLDKINDASTIFDLMFITAGQSKQFRQVCVQSMYIVLCCGTVQHVCVSLADIV